MAANENQEESGRRAPMVWHAAFCDDRKQLLLVAAEVAALGETLRREIAYFVTRFFDRMLAALLPATEGRGGKSGAERGAEGPKISPNPVQP